MKNSRRLLLKGMGLGGAWVAFGSGILTPQHVVAAWGEAAFQTEGLDKVLASIGAGNAARDDRLQIEAPEIASNGSVVPVTVTSGIPDTEWLAILAEKNPLPLLGIFEFQNGAQAYASTRIKMRNTSPVKVLAKAGEHYYINERLVKVTIGGCGG